MSGKIFGFLLATYFLVGRWSIGRLDGSVDIGPVHEQPRVWIVALLVALIIAAWPRRASARIQPRTSKVDFAVVLFLVYMIGSSCWAQNSELASDKVFELCLLLVVAVAAAASRSIFASEHVQYGFWCAIVLTGLAMAYVAFVESASGRVYVPGGGPNTFGRNMGMMGLGAVFLSGKLGSAARPFLIATILIALLLIVNCGSRGALLSSAVGILTLIVAARVPIAAQISAAGTLALVSAILLSNTETGKNALVVFQTRIVDQTLYKHYLADRDELWLDAVDMIAERPWLGWGLNGYRANSWTYPHNIFLEVIVEGGVVGLLLILNIVRALWPNLSRRQLYASRVVFAALALLFTSAQTSGDLFDSRGVFLFIALATPTLYAASRSLPRRTRYGLTPVCISPAPTTRLSSPSAPSIGT